jgi:ankyrin repeat protein
MDDHFSSFLSAAENGDLALLKRLASGDPALLNRQTGDGSTALHLAAFHGYVDCCDYLVSELALLNITDVAQRTPLHIAAQSGHLEVVECLIQKDAVLDAIDKVHFWFSMFFFPSSGHPTVSRCRSWSR